jgi:hypothetical protein
MQRNDRRFLRNVWLAAALLAAAAGLGLPAHAADEVAVKFDRSRTQFIAALGDPGATSGTGAQHWGLWPLDPGPRGVRLDNYERLKAAGGVAPARWKFSAADWWLEENGLIMEQPEFPVPPGKYLVTGARGVTAVLTIHPADQNGDRRWELADRATLHDVTHLGCRSARYTPASEDGSCSPARASRAAFPVPEGGAMPPVEGCRKQDYSVLIVIGVAVESARR